MNRAQRRQQARKGKVPPPRNRPVPQAGQFGVAVDVVDGMIHFTLYVGSTVIVTEWTAQDTKQIASMLDKAADQTGEQIEIVRQSGLVVPPPGTTL